MNRTKITVYLDADDLADLDAAVAHIRRIFGCRLRRSRFAREAIRQAVADLRNGGLKSITARHIVEDEKGDAA